MDGLEVGGGLPCGTVCIVRGKYRNLEITEQYKDPKTEMKRNTEPIRRDGSGILKSYEKEWEG